MGFFEKIGESLSNAGKTVSQTTKNFADVTSLNSAISDREKKIKQLFQEIGKTYYESHKDDAEAEALELISSVNGLYAEIAQNREKIKQIKGIVKCANCGADVPANATFCNSCGTRVERAVPEEEVVNVPEDKCVCPACRAIISKGNRFCEFCGAKIEPEE